MKYYPDLLTPPTIPLKMFRIDCWNNRMCCPDQPARDYTELLRHRLARLQNNQPLIIMVHGAGFSPFASGPNAQKTIYARYMMPNSWANKSWPVRFAPSNIPNSDCLAISWGWNAMGNSLLKRSKYQEAFETAHNNIDHFTDFIQQVSKLSGTREIHILCQGMGAHIALQSLRNITSTNIKRVVILDGHTFSAKTLLTLNSPIARQIQFFNVIDNTKHHKNTWLNNTLPKSGPMDVLVGLQFIFNRSNWMDLHLNQPNKHSFIRSLKRNPFMWLLSKRNDFNRSHNRGIRSILFNARNTNISEIRNSKTPYFDWDNLHNDPPKVPHRFSTVSQMIN